MSDKKDGDFNAKRPRIWLKVIIIIFAVFVVQTLLIVLVVFSFKKFTALINQAMPRSQTLSYISVLKDASAEISHARAEKNDLNAANESIFGMKSIAADFPDNIYPYTMSIFNWGNKVNEAASKKDTLSSPEAPDKFKLSLSNKDAVESYGDIMTDIDHFKNYGDYAFAKKDQDGMSWIAARIQADQIFLNGLDDVTIADSKADPEGIAYAATKYGATCYYGRGHTMTYSGIKKADCLKKLNSGLEPVRKAAHEYATGEAKNADDWNKSWDEIKGLGIPISTVGATVGDDNFATPPAMKVFQDACKAIGGNTPAGATMDGLPTSESGQTCTYKGPKGGFCWRLQTNSGGNYAGGDGDCPHENVLPVKTKTENPLPSLSDNSSDSSASSPSASADSSPPASQDTNQYIYSPEPQNSSSEWDGTYVGSSGLADGVANLTFTISGTSVTGTGTYVGNDAGYQVSLPVRVVGSVSSSGSISATVSASGTVAGQAVGVSGPLTGQINASGSITCNYSVSGSDSQSGTLVLNRQ